MKKKITSFKKTTINILMLYLCTLHFGYSQNLEKFHISDTLKNYTYDELYDKQDLYWNDTLKAKIYINAYLNKAKNENDTVRMAYGYEGFATISKNDKYGIMFYDSIVNLTKNTINFIYPGFAYMAIGNNYFNLGNYEKSLKNLLIAQNYAIKRDNKEQLLLIKESIACIKLYSGKYNESLEIFKTILTELNQLTVGENSHKQHLYLNALLKISNTYIYKNQLDSAVSYSKKGLIESLMQKDSFWYYEFVNQTGVIAFYQNKFENALDSINKSERNSTSPNSLLDDLYYKGSIYLKQNKLDKALTSFKKADSIYNLSRDVTQEVREIQEFFINYYKEKNDIQNQLKYIDRLLYVDSVINHNRIFLNETITKKYDTPLLLSEKEKIIINLNYQKEKNSIIIFGLAILLLFALSTIFFYYKKNNTYRKRFNKIIENNGNDKQIINAPSKENLNISEEIIETILIKLESFENKHQFTRNKTTLQSLSKSLDTNSNYLSKIINQYKGKNFSSYISDLRISYCIEKLKTDNTFRKYAIKAIAFEIGYNNTESFSKAFYKKTGVYPSYFIKKMEKKNRFYFAEIINVNTNKFI